MNLEKLLFGKFCVSLLDLMVWYCEVVKFLKFISSLILFYIWFIKKNLILLVTFCYYLQIGISIKIVIV